MPLTINDYNAAAAKLGVDVASVRAVASVESRGTGFFSDGRPAILFERHIFYKELLAKRNAEAKNLVKLNNPTVVGNALEIMIGAALRNAKNAVDQIMVQKPTICNRTAGGYLGGTKEYARLADAIKIDEEAALRSCSWGAFQIMGFHSEFLGYKNVQEFVEKMKASDKEHLDAFCRFIIKNPSLHKALKAKNWEMFAKLYNGPAYAKNKYDTKLATAYNTFTVNPNLA